MGSVVRIPPELEAFIRLQPPQSLLVRGPPGSGKTMLSLALVEAFPGRRIYVSLRVSREGLFEQIPWLGKIPPGDLEIVDASDESDHVGEHARAAGASARLIEDRGLSKEEREFIWLPAAVQSAWSLAQGPQPTLIIFDSWDAVIDQYFERTETTESLPSRAEIERGLLNRMMRGNITLVMVLERDTPSILDYHVNGIVSTFRQNEEERLERWLGLPKLRGVAIRTDLYPFTLAHGKFSAITPSAPGERYRLSAPAVDPHPEAQGIWPGSTDYAQGFGRLRAGELTLMGLDSAVPREVHRVLLGPMLIQTLRTGGQALLISPPSMDPEDAFQSIQEFVPRETLKAQLRVMTLVPPRGITSEISEVFLTYNKVGWTKSGPTVPVPEDPGFLHRAQTTTNPSLIIAYLSGLQSLAETSGVTLSAGVLTGIDSAIFPNCPVHVVAVGRMSDPRIETLSPVAEVHIRVRCPHGRIFLNGHRPYLAPLVMSQELGAEPYRLTPVL
jgi:KaiC/GvpD/RAD55 family RecA-like ATPase